MEAAAAVAPCHLTKRTLNWLSMNDISTLSIAVAVLMTIGGIVVDISTHRRGRWGINLGPVSCPQCGQLQPLSRLPTSWRQGLWGGWTCRGCGAEMDKWGRRS
jgi:hypothetical protein